MCLYFCTILYSVTMTAEAAHSSLQALATPLQAALATEQALSSDGAVELAGKVPLAQLLSAGTMV